MALRTRLGSGSIRQGKDTSIKHLLFAASLAAVAFKALAADVGVSVSVGQPGFYGRIDIGSFPPPQVIYTEPVVQRVPAGIAYEPIYLRVPPGHEKHWGKHCHRYNACGRPVYFVEDRWYNDVYVPEHRRRHGRHHDNDDRGDGESHGRGHRHGHND